MFKGTTKLTLALVTTTALLASPLSAFANPPAWAPAYGWRAKHQTATGNPYFLNPVSSGFGHCNRDLIGGLLGGVAGGALGSTIGSGSGRTIATITGVVVGALLGGSIGQSMDAADRACYGETFDHAPNHDTVSWANPQTGAVYRVTPQSTWQTSAGQYCRAYVSTARIDGRVQTVHGTACRQPDGSWHLTN